MIAARKKKKTGLDPVSTDPNVQRLMERLRGVGIQAKNFSLAAKAINILFDENPITLRGLFYRLVSSGSLPSTDRQHYQRLSRLLVTLREAGIVPFRMLVDNVRSTLKPSSWSGLADYAETVRHCYRLDFWERLPSYAHIIVEKDAIAATIQPVTEEYDVALSPIRGYASLSFAHEIASTWQRIEKPITAYYMGDFDPSGFDLERDLRSKLERYCDRNFAWVRLGVDAVDFDFFDLIPLAAKKTDARSRRFVQQHGQRCAELDALPPTEIRRRVREAIESHIPQREWKKLQRVERLERESFSNLLDQLGGAA